MQRIIRGGLTLQRNILFNVQKSQIIRQQHLKASAVVPASAAATATAEATKDISRPTKGIDDDVVFYFNSF
jgi:hypothetical protein